MDDRSTLPLLPPHVDDSSNDDDDDNDTISSDDTESSGVISETESDSEAEDDDKKKKNPIEVLVKETEKTKRLIKKAKKRLKFLKRENRKEQKVLASLHTACANNQYADVVDIVLRHRGIVHARDSKGGTALHYVGGIEAGLVLFACGADKGASDNYGITPLKAASSRGNFDIVKLLLDDGTEEMVIRTQEALELIHLKTNVNLLQLMRDSNVVGHINCTCEPKKCIE